MAESAETPVGLRDVHTPLLAPSDVLADGFLAAAIGMALALLVGLLLRPLTRRIRSPRELVLTELADCRELAPAERLMVQARLLSRFTTELKPSAELMAKLRRALYEPGDGAEAERLEHELSLLFRRLRS